MAKLPSPEFVGVRLDAAHGPIVGREVDIAYLHQCLDKVWRGTRQIIFVTGEAGLGKTTVVEAFVTEAERKGTLWLGRGQCVEHYGAGEAYMPVLEALRAAVPHLGKSESRGLPGASGADLAGSDALASQRCRSGEATTLDPGGYP